ncbi:MAG: hypothetical protein M1831_002143 [Alyxoria varia]|nr:MAG: hypothetical protein M1831_002143 [Alyxoria varia]
MERAPSAGASPSPERRLSNAFSRRERRNEIESSTSSLVGSEALNVPERGGFRASVDRGLDRFKDKTRSNSNDTERRSSRDSPNRLSNIISKTSKRRKKGKAYDDDNNNLNGSEADLDSSGGDNLGVPASNDSKLHLQSVNASTDSLARDRSGGSSILTEDSGSEIPATTRPAIQSRASHREYLTFSSPLVDTETVDPSESQSDPSKPYPSASPADDNTSQPSSGDKAEPSQRSSISQNRSPAERFKDVFNSVTNKQSGPAASEDSEPRKSSTFPPRKELEKRPASSSKSTKPSVRSIVTFPSDRPGTPSTYVTPPTPVLRQDSPPRSNNQSNTSLGSLPPVPIIQKPSDSVKHRRARSATTGKTGAPALSPQAEEVKTPGGSLITPSGSSGFFSSVFSATQNAVTQISNLANPSGGGLRSRSGTDPSEIERRGSAGGEEVFVPNLRADAKEGANTATVANEPAVSTLGSGDLSLSHLGITDGGQESKVSHSNSNSIEAMPRSRASTQETNGPSQSEENYVAEAVSAAYSKPASDKSVPVYGDIASGSGAGRPRSTASTVGITSAEGTPPRSVTTTEADAGSIVRSGSIRSRVSAGRRKKVRNSSASTGGAIAAALGASHATLVNPSRTQRRPTGFAVASSKRNREFHQQFRSVPEDDYLIDDYSGALQRDILLQGRMFVSERHVCFSSNILGWVTNLVISFDEVVSIEKKSTAVIFPNAIVLQTLHSKHVFASFMSRDSTYDTLVSIWKVGNPNLKSSENGYAVEDTKTGDRTEIMDAVESGESDDESHEPDEEDEDDDDVASSTGQAPSVVESDSGTATRVTSHKVSQSTVINGTSSLPAGKASEAGSPPATGAQALDFPGPATHLPSECADQSSHYDKICMDTTIPAPLGKVYSMMFGPISGVVLRKFLVDDQKCTDVQLEDDKKGLGEDVKTNSYSYIKPLNASIGPKQTKCIVTQTLDALDLEKAVSVTCSTQTPDVPSGNVFVTKTKYCLMWGPADSTRMVMNCTVEWSGKSWLKGPIEKGASDGQNQHGKDLATFLRAQLTAGRPAKSAKPGKSVKGKKKKTSAVDGAPGAGLTEKAAAAAAAKEKAEREQPGGVLGMLMDLLSPAGQIVTPLMTPTGVLAVLLGVMTVMWWSGAGGVGGGDAVVIPGRGLGGQAAQRQRSVAYEQLWRDEEKGLWDWLEARLDFDPAASITGAAGEKVMGKGSTAASPKGMNERQVDEAVRVTEERLAALKKALEGRRKEGVMGAGAATSDA